MKVVFRDVERQLFYNGGDILEDITKQHKKSVGNSYPVPRCKTKDFFECALPFFHLYTYVYYRLHHIFICPRRHFATSGFSSRMEVTILATLLNSVKSAGNSYSIARWKTKGAYECAVCFFLIHMLAIDIIISLIFPRHI